ncbi:MAG: 2-C-methyl-D-erythritol 4-phosphate cytidylyltransferase [Chloroflexi bacterium]|nr:2-C-methyl-D-erythritol 4-phosphate cytidylyltransferase [Chloroflexota bacterium]
MSEEAAGAIIPAAGLGRRLGGVEKALAELAGKPLVSWAVDIFQRCSQVHRIALVLRQESLEVGRRLASESGWSKVEVCPGGPRRQDSVLHGLSLLKDCPWVIVHDGARPLVDEELVRRGLEAARETGAAAAALPVADTIKEVGEDHLVMKTPERRLLWAVQTPQVFRRELLETAYRQAGAEEATDDASLVERAGVRVKVYPGSPWNIKVTTREDLLLAELLLRERQGQRAP